MRASALLAAFYAAWGLLYVWRTSFLLDGERIFVLWDDAMISMRYASNLVAGDGLVWTPGERVQGISNLGVTLAMAALHGLPVGELRQSLLFQLANLALLLGILALAARLARELVPGDRLLPVLAAAAAALYAPLSIWSLQGSDVGPVVAVLLGALVVSARTLRERRGPSRAAWALLGLGVFLRLDVAVLFAAFIAFAALQGRRAWRSSAEGSALLAACLGAALAFGALYYGDPLPNTFYLKATGAPIADVLANGARQIGGMLTPLSPVLLAVALAGGWLLRRDPLLSLSALCVLALFAYDLGVGGDWLKAYHSRFLVPAVALYCVLHAAAARAVLARGALRSAPRCAGGTDRAGASSRCLAPSRSTRRSPPASGCGPRRRRSGGRRTARTRRSPSTCASRRRRTRAWRSTPPGRPATSPAARPSTCSGSPIATSRSSRSGSFIPATRNGIGTTSCSSAGRM